MSALDPIAQILTNGTYPSNSCLTNEVLCLVAAPDGDCPPCDIITPTMMDFLNITSMDTFFQAYCTNAPSDDSCLFGLCPNSDVAGESLIQTSPFCLLPETEFQIRPPYSSLLYVEIPRHDFLKSLIESFL